MSDHCESCGKPWVGHPGVEPICAELQAIRASRDEHSRRRLLADCERMRHRQVALELENKSLRKELLCMRSRRDATEKIKRT